MAPGDTFFRFLAQDLPEAILALTGDGHVFYLNAAAEKLFGYKLGEVESQPITTLVPVREDRRADPMKWLERWAADADDNAPRFLDLFALTKAGEDLPLNVRVHKSALDGADYFLVTVRDVSAQRVREADQRNQALRAMRILQIAEDAIISIDEEQNIIFANLKAEELFGYSADELMGKPVSLLLPDQARAGHAEQVAAFGKSKIPSKRMSARGAISGKTKDGRIVPLEASITNVTVGGTSTYTAHLRDRSTDH